MFPLSTELEDEGFWRSLLPSLTLSSLKSVKKGGNRRHQNPITNENASSVLDDLGDDGFSLRLPPILDSAGDAFKAKFMAVKEGIQKLSDEQLPPTFIMLFDEVWELADIYNRMICDINNQMVADKRSSNWNVFNFDVLAWCVDPKKGEVGFSPHRDRQPKNERILSSFHDGKCAHPKYQTVWLAMSDATPDNSCLYVIPRPYDPGYLKGDDDLSNDGNDATNVNDENITDPLRRCLPTKESYQNIRCLARRAGESITFTHRLIHWGSSGSPKNSPHPRIAISFVFSSSDFEKPYLTSCPRIGQDFLNPTFEQRLVLCCAQLIIYYQRFPSIIDFRNLNTVYGIVKRRGDSANLEPAYKAKVVKEFLTATRELNTNKNELDSEEEEGLLDAMLENDKNFYADDDDEVDNFDDFDAENDDEDYVNGSGQEIPSSDDEEEEFVLNHYEKKKNKKRARRSS